MQTLLDNKYRIISTLGSGGMGTVYLAENIQLGTKWAVKAVRKNSAGEFDLLAEPNILKKLNHPAFPRIVHIEEDENTLYIVEDYIEGLSLDKQLKTHKSFDEATVVGWAKQLCGILNYLHTQKPNPIIYRDIKPSNIIVTDDNIVKVIDFGIAREYKTDTGHDTSYIGTRGYAAPEQYGTSQTDARTDIYSLGVTMYHLLTGKSPNSPPYEFKPLRQVDSSFSEGIEFIVNKCVQNDPANRYQSTVELYHDLENIYTFNTVYRKQKKTGKISMALKCLMLTAFVVLFGVSAINISHEKSEHYKALVNEGYNHLNVFQFEEALNCFNEAKGIDKNHYDAFLGIAQIYVKQGKYDDCIAYLNEIAVKIPQCKESAQYNYLMGSVLYYEEKYDQAIMYFENACDFDSSRNEYPRDLAVCYAKLGNLTKAHEILDTITYDGQTDDVLNYVKGQVLYAEKNVNDAIRCFENTLNISLNEDLKTRSYIELSNIYKEMRNGQIYNDDAVLKQITVLERAEKDLNNKDNLVLIESMAEAYFTAKNYDMAIKKFTKLLDLGYERAYIYRNIAIIHQQVNNFTEAEMILKEMQRVYPDNYQCYVQFSYLYMDIEGKKAENVRDYSVVEQYYNLAVQYSPDGINNPEIMQLTAKMNELRDKGWL